MIRLKVWQWIVLALPLVTIISFLLISAGLQIHEWRINWIWGVFILVFVGWRWLLVRWTQPVVGQMEAVVAQVSKELDFSDNTSDETTVLPAGSDAANRAEVVLQDILKRSQDDRPIWEDWLTFWQRCQELVTAIAQIYYPEVKYPLLNIYIPQAYALIRNFLVLGSF